MLNSSSSSANSNLTYPIGISGRILPSGYTHFADDLQDQKSRNGSSYIITFPSGWDENVAEKERYSNLQTLQNTNEVFFPIYTSGINRTSATASYTASLNSVPSTMSNLFG
jgi:hypothetical protein